MLEVRTGLAGEELYDSKQASGQEELRAWQGDQFGEVNYPSVKSVLPEET
jgi:hypothetical protein